MMSDVQNSDRNYRRGTIMGLTMAEAFVLICFALLLLFAFWQREVEKQNTPEVQKFKELSDEKRQTVLVSAQDGSIEAFISLKERGIDFAALAAVETSQEKWRFIDKDELRRLVDAAENLPENMQRDLADMVKAGRATDILREMAVLEDLEKAGKTVADLREVAQLIDESGKSVEELRNTAQIIESLNISGKTIDDILATAAQLEDLEKAGKTVADLSEVAQLIDESGKSVEELRNAAQIIESLNRSGKTIDDILATAAQLEDLEKAGKTVADLREVAQLIDESGKSVEKLRNAAQIIESLNRSGKTIDDILATAAQLEDLEKAGQTLEGISNKIRNAEAQKAALVGTLRSKLGGIVADVGGHIDDTGAIILPDEVLFQQGRANITLGLDKFLADACLPWLSTLKNSGVDIAEVKVEGHASSEWKKNSTPEQAFLGNLDLSQSRSQAVLKACLGHISDPEILTWARKHLIAVGYSSVRPILKDGEEDRKASRRVVFSVTPNRKSLLEEIESEARIDANRGCFALSKPVHCRPRKMD